MRNDGFDAAKLLALVLMVGDHVLIGLDQPWPYRGYLIGRACLPIFASIMVMRLANGDIDPGPRVLQRLVVWALVAQPIYTLLVGDLVTRASVLATLAVGVCLIMLLQRREYVWLFGAGVATVVGGYYLDGGALIPLGQLLAFVVLKRWSSPILAFILVASACAAGDLANNPGDWFAPALALCAIPVLCVSSKLACVTPRLPGWIFYAFYPAHLAIIYLWLGPYR